MGPPPSRIKALGEIALRVADLDAMQRFYEQVIGLPLLRRFPRAAFFKIAGGFFKIAGGYAGHTQVLALFDRSAEPGYRGLDPARTTVDHLAFAIARRDYEHERARLAAHGLEVELAEHPWVGWRSLYVRDPEGNQVELVCYDETLRQGVPAA